MSEERSSACCVVGAGPAGVMLSLLLARQGVNVVLLEAHINLERDFRGDSLHSSTLELMDQLGLVDRLLELPHGTVERFMLHTPKGAVPFHAPGDPDSKYPHMLRMRQSLFLECLVSEARRYSSFHVVFGARVESLIEEDEVVRGVRYRDAAGVHELRAVLTVGADGRFSKVRQLLGFEPLGKAQPMDFLWFRLPHLATDPSDADGVYVGHARVMTVLDQGAEWQIACWIPRDGYRDQRAAGLADLRACVTRLAPWLGDRADMLRDWSQITVLAIESSRLRRWYRPGVLLLGDAAHVMSPIGGVGINLAIQDAVAASNRLGPKLRTGQLQTADLAAVQRRRERPTRLIQFLQGLTLRQVIAASQASSSPRTGPPLGLRLARRLPFVSALRGRLFARGGFRAERIRPVVIGKVRTATVALAVLLLGAACAGPNAAGAATPVPSVHVKVSDPNDVSAAPIYIAEDQGYFRAEGLEVELVSVSQAVVVQAVATDQLQFGLTLPSPPLFNALEGNIPVKIVASAIVNREADRPAAFLVRRDLIDSGAYRSASDLRGATIAVPAEAAQFYAERFLLRGGLTRDDVTIVNITDLPSVLAAFSTRRIAAAWLPEPFVTSAERQDLAKVVAASGELLPGAETQTLIMAGSLDTDHPEIARGFMRGYVRGLRAYYHAINKGDADRGPVVQALMNHTPIKDPSMYSVMGLPSMDPNGALHLVSWSVFQRYFVERGLQRQSLDLAPYVDLGPLDAALQSLGTDS